MSKLLLQLWAFKPDSLPNWMFALLLLFTTCLLLGAAGIAAWVLLTQIDYM
jgi:hypothetical protein